MKWIAILYAVASLVTFLVYALDKRRARQDGRRVPERVLHGLELAGGWPGAFAAQRLLRHKNRKLSFQVVFWGIVVLHLAAWGAWLWSRWSGGGEA